MAFRVKPGALAAHPEVAAVIRKRTAISSRQNFPGPNIDFVFMNISLAWIAFYLSP
jgi:hypothetical protein